jgi:hypothetical protein
MTFFFEDYFNKSNLALRLQGKPFDYAQGKPSAPLREQKFVPYDFALGKPFGFAQG